MAISIGPVNLELIKQELSKGFMPSWLVGVGAMTADIIIMLISLGIQITRMNMNKKVSEPNSSLFLHDFNKKRASSLRS